MTKHICNLIFILFLSACTTISQEDIGIRQAKQKAIKEQIEKELNNSSLCCRDGYKNLNFVSLSFDKEIDFKIDNMSPAHSFKTGRSYLKAVSLPEFQTPYDVELGVFYIDPKEKRFFRPIFMFLDANYQTTKIVEQLTFTQGNWGEYFYTNLPVTSANDKHLLIFTSPEYVEKKSVTFHYGIKVVEKENYKPGNKTMILPGTFIPLTISQEEQILNLKPFSYDGKFTIKVK